MTNEVRIRASTKDDASRGLDNIRDKFHRLQKDGAKGFAIGAGAAITAKGLGLLDTALSSTIDFMGDSISKASDLNETLAKSGKVFGDHADEIEAWGDTTADTMGLSKQAAIAAAAGFGDLFNKMDETKGASLEMSTGLVKLSSDLASFHNLAGGSEEALEKLRSGLAGESEPLRSLGVFLNEAKVNARAAALGFEEVNGKFTEGAKIAARYSLIMEETASAQGDFADTADELANSQRIANAEWENAQATLGQHLIPLMTEGAKVAAGLAVGISEISDAFSGMDVGDDNPIVGIVKALGDFDRESAKFLDDAGDLFTFWDGYSSAADDARQATEVAAQGIANQLDFAAFHAKELAGEVADSGSDIDGSADGISDSFGKIGGGAKRAAKQVHRSFEDILDEFNTTKDALETAGQEAADAIYDPIIAKAELASIEREIAEQKQIIASKKSTKEQVRDAKLRLAELNKSRIEHMAELAAYGKLSHKQQVAFIKDLRKQYLTATAAQRAAIDALIRKLQALAIWQNKAKLTGMGGLISPYNSNDAPSHNAIGGHVAADEPAIVGEYGPELFVPKAAGAITPASQTSQIMSGSSGGSTWSGGGSMTLNVTVNASPGMTPGQAREIGEAFGPAVFEWGRRNRWLSAR